VITAVIQYNVGSGPSDDRRTPQKATGPVQDATERYRTGTGPVQDRYRTAAEGYTSISVASVHSETQDIIL